MKMLIAPWQYAQIVPVVTGHFILYSQEFLRMDLVSYCVIMAFLPVTCCVYFCGYQVLI